MFAAKCTACHGPNLAKPKGRFGYVTDLARVVANREIVVPSAPEESQLWELVRRGEMPPDDSPAGPLSAEQKETIRAWIAAGAPAEESKTAGSVAPPDDQATLHEPGQLAASYFHLLLSRLGRFHILVIHFPIALLLGAALAEMWLAIQQRRAPSPVVRFCVLLGAASAAVAAALGWLHAGSGFGAGAPEIMTLHRWLGTTTAVLALGAAALSEWEEHRGVRSWWFRAWLLVTALLVIATGHFGGTLVHGQDFLTGG